ncbi:AAA family ATPase [Nesterenkonia sp. Act20]|uniref:AAA family ATPase n=1 Tax=Nesterenkonia sp. Act20 TaxID=1483432 RepID=UPI001C464ACD|nr:AAA family ATPase [Nesterenkonia sp. Act20]
MQRWSVVTTGALRADHIAAVEGLQGPVTIERRCADLAELVAVCRTGRSDAALVIGSTELLTATVLADLQEGDRQVVAISAVAEERARLRNLGLTCFDDDVGAEALAAALQGRQPARSAASAEDSDQDPAPDPDQAPSQSHGAESRAGAWSGWGHGEEPSPLESMDPPMVERVSDEAVPPSIDRSSDDQLMDDSRIDDREAVHCIQGITVVWGAPGSPGRSTVAVNLAAEIALQGQEVLLVDADTVAASLVPQLGLMEETAGLAQACRAADLGRLDPQALQTATSAVQVSGARLALLSGLPRAARWPEIRERSLRAVLQLARTRYDYVIVDVAACVEQDEELSYDTLAPQRNGAALTCLRHADRVLAVGAADAVSFSRLVKAIEDLQLSLPETAAAQVDVVINKVRSEVIGRSPRDQLGQTWRRLGPDRGIAAFLPMDASGCDAALLAG